MDASGITADDFFVTDDIDDTTLVLFAIGRQAATLSAVTVGLTGGIGSGKSTLARMLESKGAVLIDADAIAREVVAPDGPAYGPVVERFGDAVARTGRHDRPQGSRGDRLPRSAQALADLNAATHPVIGQLMVERRERPIVRGPWL